MISRYRYAVAISDQPWIFRPPTKRKAKRLFSEVKLPLGASAVLTRTHKRTGVVTVLAERYQPPEPGGKG